MTWFAPLRRWFAGIEGLYARGHDSLEPHGGLQELFPLLHTAKAKVSQVGQLEALGPVELSAEVFFLSAASFLRCMTL